MSLSIYDIDAWQNSPNSSNLITYKKNSVVSNGSYYYYALKTHTSPLFNTFDQNYYLNNNFGGIWGGISTDDFGNVKPTFVWSPSYGSNIPNTPRVKTIQFGDGYIQRVKDGINNNLLRFDLTFDGRDADELRAIAHFLYAREGVSSFLWVPPAPYNKTKYFVCAEWTPGLIFYDNSTIKATFVEVPV